MESSTKELNINSNLNTNTNINEKESEKIPTLYQFIPKDERGLTQKSIEFLNSSLGRDKVKY
jgi:hypothetical protein